MRYIQFSVAIFLVTLFSGTSCLVAAEKTQVKKADVRLLIDISGSMKKNDPNNLRIPALQLVTNLLPKGSDAGVWAFGRYVNMMVPLSKVDQKWQVNATNTAKKINSRGLFTNIGSVLQKASYGWTSKSPKEKRSMVLLTDGMVDISKDPQVNAKERKRILEDILPKLRKAGVAIHTIALSENADHELLKELSKQTDGWYESVNNAEQLQKVFLNQIKKTARQSCDLVTLQKPETGQWKIDADVDPDNRVMVVSQLGLDVSEVPNNLLSGEAINYQFRLLEEGSVIENQDFLGLVDARLEQNKAGQKSKMAMFYDSANFNFKQNFFTDSFEGELQLKLLVKSPTFERIRTHAINIYGSPLQVEVEPSSDNIAPHKIHLSVRDDIVQSDSIKINAVIAMPDGEKLFVGVSDITKAMEIATNLEGGDYSIEFTISGQSVLGREFEVTPAATTFSAISSIIEPIIETPTAAESEPKKEVKESIESEKTEAKEQEQVEQAVIEEEPVSEQPTEEVNWLYWGLGINLILAVLGFFAWRLIRKRNTKGVSDLTDELGIDDEDDE